MGLEEMVRSFSKRAFVRALKRLVPEVLEGDLVAGGSGVRAQALAPSGQLVDDFLIVERPRALHVCNAPSPAATASLAIAEEIMRRAAACFELGRSTRRAASGR
jgi:L-2-hydroxyglutarate oxidase